MLNLDLNFKRLLLIFLPVYLRSRIPCMQVVTHGPFHTAKSAAMEESYCCFSSKFFQARAWSLCCNAITVCASVLCQWREMQFC